MAASKGIAAIGTYSGLTAVAQAVAVLQGLVANPDVYVGQTAYGGGFPPSSGITAGGGASNTYLDEMSPPAATQLQVELAALASANNYAYGSYTVTAGDATNTYVDIPTGLASFTLTKVSIGIRRSGSKIADDTTLTQAVNGTIHAAHNSTYVFTAGDIITWAAS